MTRPFNTTAAPLRLVVINAGVSDPSSTRMLVDRIAQQMGEQGLTVVPLAMYFKNGRAKVELGLARGLKRYDKREKIAEREVARDLARARRREA